MNKAASDLAKIRWGKTSKQQRIAHALKMVQAKKAKKASKTASQAVHKPTLA